MANGLDPLRTKAQVMGWCRMSPLYRHALDGRFDGYVSSHAILVNGEDLSMNEI